MFAMICACGFRNWAPVVTEEEYVNPFYEFSVKIPEGWAHTQIIPEWFRKGLSHSDMEHLKIMFYNNRSNGIIGIKSDRYVLDWAYAPTSQFKKAWIEYCESEKKKYNGIHGMVYSYNINDPSPSYWYDPHVSFTERLYYNNEDQKIIMEFRNLIYSCDNSETCFITFFIVSESAFFNINIVVYEKIIESFKTFSQKKWRDRQKENKLKENQL